MSPRSIFEMSDKGRDLYERVLEFVDGAAKVQLQVSPVGGVRR